MAEEIEIIIGADTTNLNAELTKSQNLLKQFEAALKKSTNAGEINYLTGQVDKLKQSIASLSQAQVKSVQGSTQAAQSIQNLSRVVQDAPFGFIGIANNINPLVESFGRLKSETGSTGGAIKALVGGLSGAAGLGLAFGAVTSAITFAQIGFQAWNSNSKEARDNFDIFKKDLEALKRELNAVTDSLKKFIQETQQAVKLSDINIVARFEDKTEQSVLQRQSKFISLAYELEEANKARNKSYQNYVDVVAQSFATQEDANKAQQAALDIYNEAIKTENDLIAAKELQAATNRAATIEDARAAEQKRKDDAKRLADLDSISKTLAKLREDTRDQISLGVTFNVSTLQEQAKLVQAAITKLITVFNVDPKNAIILKLKADLFELNMQIKRENLVLPVTLKLENQKVKPLDDATLKKALKIPSLENIRVATGLADLFSGLPPEFFKPFNEKTLKGISDQFNSTFETIAEDVAILFGQTLGDALTGQGNIGNFFQGIYKSLGANLEELGKYLVKTAIEIEFIQKTLFTNPFLAIAGGIALIAIGRAISNSMNRNAFAVGTRNAPGGMALVGERGPELINLPRGSQVIPAAQTSNIMGGMPAAVEIYGILRGQDIYFSNKKYSATYARTT